MLAVVLLVPLIIAALGVFLTTGATPGVLGLTDTHVVKLVIDPSFELDL